MKQFGNDFLVAVASLAVFAAVLAALGIVIHLLVGVWR